MARARSEKRAGKRGARGGGDAADGRGGIGTEVTALAALALTAFFFVATYSEQTVALGGDATLTNACGRVGRWLAGISMSFCGLFASYVVVAVAIIWGACSFFRVRIVGWPWRLGGAMLLLLMTAALEWALSASDPIIGVQYAPVVGTQYLAGGYWGTWLGGHMFAAFGQVGLYLVAGLMLLIGTVLVADVRVSPIVRLMFLVGGKTAVEVGRRLPGWLGRAFQRWPPRFLRLPRIAPRSGSGDDSAEAQPATASSRGRRSKTRPATARSAGGSGSRGRPEGGGTGARSRAEDSASPASGASDEKTAVDTPAEVADEYEYVYVEEGDGDDGEGEEGDFEELEADEGYEEGDGEYEYVDEGEKGLEDAGADSEDSSEDDSGDEEWEPAADGAPRAPRRIVLSTPSVEATESLGFEETQLSLNGVYSLPSIDFLADPKVVDHAEGRDELDEVAERIEETLGSFKVDAQVVEVQRGPSITQYEVSIAAGIKVHKIVGLSDDLAMALSARSIRVVAPIPGKNAVGIEVPNRKRETVCLKELLLSQAHAEAEAALPLMLGKDVSGSPIIADLTGMPHLLIAGSTGSGKSVCINSIISSMLMTRSPEELKLILVDPKMVELSSFEEIPHLLTPVITDMKKAPAALDWIVRKMDQRYALLAHAEVRNITGFNALDRQTVYDRLAKKIGHEEAEKTPERLPFIVVIIDELADLMMTASKEVEASIIRLAQKSRAVGIHVILATQRPSVDVITGLIKSNMPCRISFMVTSRVDSRTILDRNGAEKLLGQGDMLYQAPGTSDLVRAQSTFISDKEIRKIVRFLKKESKPEFSREIETHMEGGAGGGSAGGGASRDDLYDSAVRIILESQRGSVSLLQRRLGIGYTRASRLMDMMGESGLVGPFKGSKAREVFLTLEEWEEAQGG